MKRFKRGSARRSGAALVMALGLTGSLSIAPAAHAACDGIDANRVDLGTPKFSNPTRVTNPLFPEIPGTQIIHLGTLEGEPLRFETTVLSRTKTVKLNGKNVEAVVHQYVAFQDGRIIETAYDYFAQDDAGNVWYLGEAVDNYEDGVISDHEGTWLAGVDGPPGMIMPAKPAVGNVYRPENIPGNVFEEVTVKQTGVTVQGPRGPITGAIVVEECLLDGTTEEKIFAPGYGEFRVDTADEFAEVAVAYPIDRLRGSAPRSLDTISDGAEDFFDQGGDEDWDELAGTLDEVEKAWTKYQAAGPVPVHLKDQMTEAIAAIADGIEAGEASEVTEGGIHLEQATLDIELRYDRPSSVDRDRLETWKWQLAFDEEEGDPGDVDGDKAVIKLIKDRLR